MKIKLLKKTPWQSAYTLAEVMVAVLILGIMMGSLYGGFSTGFSMIQVTRENLRATQIMLERMETVRLYRWDQVTDKTYMNPVFTNYYYPDGLSSGGGGVVYTGAISVANMPIAIPAAYTNAMRQVSVSLGWKSGKTWRKRDMTTYVAQYGLQNYVYSPSTNSP
jgi:prepilin-type N-terminal cleavage/methylation domain-containing protein